MPGEENAREVEQDGANNEREIPGEGPENQEPSEGEGQLQGLPEQETHEDEPVQAVQQSPGYASGDNLVEQVIREREEELQTEISYYESEIARHRENLKKISRSEEANFLWIEQQEERMTNQAEMIKELKQQLKDKCSIVKDISAEIKKLKKEAANAPDTMSKSKKNAKVFAKEQDLETQEAECKRIEREIRNEENNFSAMKKSYNSRTGGDVKRKMEIYRQAREGINAARENISEAAEQQRNVRDSVMAMERHSYTSEGGATQEYLVDKENQIYGVSGETKKKIEVHREEEKVRSYIRAAPIFQSVNKEKINEYLSYESKESGIENKKKEEDSDLNDIVLEAAKVGAKKLGANGADASIVETVNNFSGTITESIMAHTMRKAAKEQKNNDNELYARIMDSAARAQVTSGVGRAINTAGSAGEVAIKASKSTGFLGDFGGLLMKTAKWGLKKVTGMVLAFMDKRRILNLPEVFGGLTYDKSKVSKDMFNKILKEETGIASRNKVYRAIKIIDAISMHAEMKKSIETKNDETDALMANLGFTNRDDYVKISVMDIMKKTGYSPKGGDWKQELRNVMAVEKETIGEKADNAADMAVNGMSSLFHTVSNTKIGAGAKWIWSKLSFS